MDLITIFLQPIQDPKAQIAIVALCILSCLDMIFGVVNVMFIRHTFSSSEFRKAIIRKIANLGIVIAADIVDAVLLSGLDLDFQPVLMVATCSLILMEV